MKTIIVGYTDVNGLSAPEILCGPETPAGEQAKAMDTAKRLHRYPLNIARLEQYVLGEPIVTAIYVSDEAAKVAQGIDANRKQREKEERARLQEIQRAEANVVAANKAFSAAAQKRNNAIAAVAAQKNLLSANIGDKDRAAAVRKIAELQPAVEQAVAEFGIVLAARDVIKNPKSLPEDIAAALEQIKDPAKALNAEREVRNAELAAAEKAKADQAAAEAAKTAVGGPPALLGAAEPPKGGTPTPEGSPS